MRLCKAVVSAASLALLVDIREVVGADDTKNRLRKLDKSRVDFFQEESEEDMVALWQRLLQFSLPTAAPTTLPTAAPTTLPPSPAPTIFTPAPVTPAALDCFVELSVECYIESISGQKISCADNPFVTTQDACLQDVNFEYTITNTCVGSNCGNEIVDDLEVERDGLTTNLTPLVSNPLIFLGTNTTAIETISLDFCVARQVNTTASVIANTTGPTVARCAADSVTAFQINTICEIEVQTECYQLIGAVRTPCENIAPPQDPSQCLVDVRYDYVVSNIGAVNEYNIHLNRIRDGAAYNLTSQLKTTSLSPGQSTTTTESNVSIDFCRGYPIQTNTTVEATPASIGVTPNSCFGSDLHLFQPTVSCTVELTISCITMTNGDAVSCDNLPTPEKATDCIKTLTYTYTVSNLGATDETIATLSRTRDGDVLDILDLLQSTSLSPGDTTIASEDVDTDFCVQGSTMTTASIEAYPPGAGAPSCTAEGSFELPIEVSCAIEVDIECSTTENGKEISCDQITIPETATDCIKTLTYTYTVSNLGATDETIATLSRTRDGDILDISDLLQSTSLSPGDTTIASEDVETDFCVQGSTMTTASIEAYPPGAGAPSCTAEGSFELAISVICYIKLDVDCFADVISNFTVPCRDFFPFNKYDVCDLPIKYVYSITNVGPVRELVTSLSVDRTDKADVELVDTPFILEPGEIQVLEDFVDIDFCVGHVDGVSASSVVQSKVNPDGSVCSDVAKHLFSPPNPPCDVTLDKTVSCTIADSDVSCHEYIASITDPTDDNQCIVDVAFSMTLSNHGLACLDVTSIYSISLLLDVDPVDITPIPARPFCPDDDLTVFQVKTINICKLTGQLLDFTVEVNGGPPDTCGGFGEVDLTLPLLPCSLDVSLTCETSDGDTCKLPARTQCDIHLPCFIDFEFTGERCNSSYNSQRESFYCHDYVTDSSATLSTVYIVAAPDSHSDPDDYFFNGHVDLGTRFRVQNHQADQPLGKYVHLLIYDVEGGNILQKIQVNSACDYSCPLFTAESFGAVTVVGFGNHHDEILLPEFHFIFYYEISNVGHSEISLETITLSTSVEHTPMNLLTAELSDVILGLEGPSSLYSDSISFYIPPVHRYELDVHAAVVGHSVPALASEACEASTDLAIYAPCEKKKCTQCPHTIYLEYTGDVCESSANEQTIYCTDMSHDSLLDKAYVTVTSDGMAKTYFSGFVQIGDIIEVSVSAKDIAHGVVLDDMVVVKVKKYGGSLTQILKFTAACNDADNPLFVGDTFGAVKVVGWYNRMQGKVKAILDVIHPCS